MTVNLTAKLFVPLQVLVVLALPLLLLMSNLLWAVGEVRLYEYGFGKYRVSQVTEIEPLELSKAAGGLVHYFNSPGEPIEVKVIRKGREFELFNEREKIHLRDVKGLVQLGRRLRIGLLVYTLFFVGAARWWLRRDFRRTLAVAGLRGSWLTLALMLAFGLIALLGFEQIFLQFHLISFSNELWLLDPARDYLIMMFPQGFFYEATLFIALATLVEAILLDGLCWAYLRVNPKG
ncbi:TIGR01906 family membrane protein [Chloroflexota bacterium]